MKSIWNGTISFGLVTIPVRMYSATEKQTLGFKMLHEKCKGPITYERWCKACNKEIAWENIVKGLKTGPDQYFVLSKEKIKELKPEKTDNVDILEFVDLKSVGIIYYDGHYFLAPDKKGAKAYYLFLEALRKTDKVAIGKFVMRDKEYLCSLTPYKDAILMTTLNYEYEIRNPKQISELSKKAPDISKTELDLAIKLINQSSKKKFDISKLKDSFTDELAKAIKKVKPVKVKSPHKIKAISTTRAENTLLSDLKKSIRTSDVKKDKS